MVGSGVYPNAVAREDGILHKMPVCFSSGGSKLTSPSGVNDTRVWLIINPSYDICFSPGTVVFR